MMRGRYNWAVAVRQSDGTIYTEEHELISGRPENSWMYWPVIRGCTALVESLAIGYKALEIAAQHAVADLNAVGEESPAASETTPIVAKTSPLTKTSPVDDVAADAVTDSAVAIADSTLSASAAAPASPALQPTSTTAALPATASAAPEPGGLPKSVMTVSMLGGLLLGIVIFVVLPAVLTNLLLGDYGQRTFLWNLADGGLRIVIFIFYIWLISRLADVRRMFAYHGAEHRTIHCLEHGQELTPANARVFPNLHVRCGTAFLLMTMIIAILVFTMVPVAAFIDVLGITNSLLRLLLVVVSRILLLPLVAGLAYEVTVKWAGSHPDNPLVRVVLWPGLQLQRLTTRTPDDGQLECAIAATQLVLARENQAPSATAPATEQPAAG